MKPDDITAEMVAEKLNPLTWKHMSKVEQKLVTDRINRTLFAYHELLRGE